MEIITEEDPTKRKGHIIAVKIMHKVVVKDSKFNTLRKQLIKILQSHLRIVIIFKALQQVKVFNQLLINQF